MASPEKKEQIIGQTTDDEDTDKSTSDDEVQESSSDESSEEESESEQESVDLRTRLATFLPELEKANEELKERPANLEHVKDGERYVEMNLGLGVLEESNGERKTQSDLEDEAPEEPPTKRRKIQEVE